QLTSYVQSAEKDFQSVIEDSVLVNSVVAKNVSEDRLKKLTKKKYFLFFYTFDSAGQPQLASWNTQQVLPSAGLLYLQGKSGFVQLQNGYYVWNSYSDKRIKVLALIPVKWNYIISNEYLQNGFADER